MKTWYVHTPINEYFFFFDGTEDEFRRFLIDKFGQSIYDTTYFNEVIMEQGEFIQVK